MDSFEIKAKFPVEAEVLYDDWLNSETHSEFTGGEAEIYPRNGSDFSAWDGYIKGTIVRLNPKKKLISMKWRTTEFETSDKDSDIDITIVDTKEGCEMTLKHSNIPEGEGEKYEEGWQENYIEPMTDFYTG